MLVEAIQMDRRQPGMGLEDDDCKRNGRGGEKRMLMIDAGVSSRSWLQFLWPPGREGKEPITERPVRLVSLFLPDWPRRPFSSSPGYDHGLDVL